MNARLRRPAVALITTTLAASVLAIAPSAQAVGIAIGGSVSGAGGDLGNVQVVLYKYDPDLGYWDESGDSTYAEPDGSWSMVVSAGDYRVGFEDYTDHFAEEYYVEADDVDAPEAETVTVPGVGSIDAVLDIAAHLGGEVRNADEDLLEGITVTLHRAVRRGNFDRYRRVGFAITGPDGSYDIGGVPGGRYILQFEDDSATYATEYYLDQTRIEAAPRITVGDGEIATDLDAHLDQASVISGEVTDGDGAPVADGFVTAYSKVGEQWIELVDVGIVDGAYALDRLPVDTYRVRFVANLDNGQALEYWQDAATVEAATDIVLDVAGSAQVANASLTYEAPAVKNTARPTITGSPTVGSTLTASTGTWSAEPDEYDYEWYADGEYIPYGWDSTYVPTEDDLGKTLTVRVTAWKAGFDEGVADSLPTAPVSGDPNPPVVPPVVTPPVVAPPVVAPPVVVTPPVVTPPALVVDVPTALAKALAAVRVTGRPKVGRTLRVADLDLDVRTAVTYKFQWFAGTKKINKATKSRLKVIRAMKGKKLSVKVTGTAGSTSKSARIKVGKVR